MVVYNLAVELTQPERASYDYWSEVRASTYSRFSHDSALASSCIASKENRLAYALSMGWNPEAPKANKDRWSPQVLGKAANMWLKASKHCEWVVTHAYQKYNAARWLGNNHPKTLVYAESSLYASELARTTAWAKACHNKLPSVQREVTTVKHYKTKPDEVLTRVKTVGAATLRKEAVEAFLLPTSPVRVLCLSRLPDYDSRLQHQPLLIECSGNTDIVERLQPQVCVHVYCANTYERNALVRKQRGQQVQEITSIHDILLTT